MHSLGHADESVLVVGDGRQASDELEEQRTWQAAIDQLTLGSCNVESMGMRRSPEVVRQSSHRAEHERTSRNHAKTVDHG